MTSLKSEMTATFAGRGTAGTIETRRSWLVAWSALGILSVSFGAPLITIVALKPIAAEFGGALDGYVRGPDDRRWARAVERRRAHRSLSRPWAVDGASRQCRDQCAALCL